MLKISNLSCIRGGRPLFTGLHFALQPGEVLFLKGANGAGKTSLLRILCGLSLPESGEIAWKDVPVQRLGAEFRREIFYLGHANALQEALTVQENLAFYADLQGRAADGASHRNALARLGVQACHARVVRQLSQGQKRRVALSRLLLTSARLWILDEPFVALDVQAIDALREILATHLHGGGMVVFTSHQLVEIDHVQPRLLELGV